MLGLLPLPGVPLYRAGSNPGLPPPFSVPPSVCHQPLSLFSASTLLCLVSFPSPVGSAPLLGGICTCQPRYPCNLPASTLLCCRLRVPSGHPRKEQGLEQGAPGARTKQRRRQQSHRGLQAGAARARVSKAVGAGVPMQVSGELQQGQEPRGAGEGTRPPWLASAGARAVPPVSLASAPRGSRLPSTAGLWKSSLEKKKKNCNKYGDGLTKLRTSFPKPRCSAAGSPVCQAACECGARFAKAGARPRSQTKYCACRSRARQVFWGVT